MINNFMKMDTIISNKPVIEIRDYSENRNSSFTFISGFYSDFKYDGRNISINIDNLIAVLKKYFNITTIVIFDQNEINRLNAEIKEMDNKIEFATTDNEINVIEKDIKFKNRSLNKIKRFTEKAKNGDLCIHKRCGNEVQQLLNLLKFNEHYNIEYRALNNNMF